MFYAIRPVRDNDGTETGKFYVAQGFDEDVMPSFVSRDFETVEEAKADYHMVAWKDGDGVETIAVGEDE